MRRPRQGRAAGLVTRPGDPLVSLRPLAAPGHCHPAGRAVTLTLPHTGHPLVLLLPLCGPPRLPHRRGGRPLRRFAPLPEVTLAAAGVAEHFVVLLAAAAAVEQRAAADLLAHRAFGRQRDLAPDPGPGGTLQPRAELHRRHLPAATKSRRRDRRLPAQTRS